jgi:hypothetical protein
MQAFERPHVGRTLPSQRAIPTRLKRKARSMAENAQARHVWTREHRALASADASTPIKQARKVTQTPQIRRSTQYRTWFEERAQAECTIFASDARLLETAEWG